MRKSKKISFSYLLLHISMIILVLMCLIPVMLVISISLTTEGGITNNGYTLIPSEFGLEAYEYIASAGKTIASAYMTTIITTVLGTIITTLVVVLYAYPLSRKDFKYRKFFTFYQFFTMLFSGGLVSWYIVCTTMLGMSNSIWALILPLVNNAWYIIIMRTFFSTGIPEAIVESGKLDGASEYCVLFQLVLPISLPGIATIALFSTLSYWNDWYHPLMFITNPKLYNLQFLLQNMMANIQQLSENQQYIGNSSVALANIPSEGARMALCMVALGPILIVYPFFQKYFIQGLTVGSIKG